MKISNLFLNPLLTGSLIMILGSNLNNFLNYVYHFLMGRLLGPSSYGELVTLISLIGLVSIIPGSFSLVVIKFISSAKNSDEVVKISNWFHKKTLLLSLIMFLLLLITSGIISNFLKIQSSSLVIITSLIFFSSLPALLNRSILQGLLKFKEYVISLLGETSTKLILGVVFIYLGYSVAGVLIGFVLATILGWLLSGYFIPKISRKLDNKNIDISPLFIFSIPVIIYSLAQTSFYSTDLILVKHYLSSYDAGIYASLSTLGKIIFFGTAPIGAVMFPLVAKRYSKGEDYIKIFLLSLLLTLALSLILILIYKLIPNLVINLLYGKLYLEASASLVWFGVFITLFALSNLFVSFYLSINKVKVVILPVLAAILQIIGIIYFHENLNSIITISIVVTTLLLASLLLYFACEQVLFKKIFVNFRHSTGLQTRENNTKRFKKN